MLPYEKIWENSGRQIEVKIEQIEERSRVGSRNLVESPVTVAEEDTTRLPYLFTTHPTLYLPTSQYI